MTEISIDASEIRGLAVDLSGAATRVQQAAPVAVRKTLLAIETDSKQAAPVDTGYLRSSISTDVDGDGLGGTVGPTANYGRFVEDGTSRMSPQPYVGPAFDRNVPPFLEAMEQAGEESTL